MSAFVYVRFGGVQAEKGNSLLRRRESWPKLLCSNVFKRIGGKCDMEKLVVYSKNKYLYAKWLGFYKLKLVCVNKLQIKTIKG